MVPETQMIFDAQKRTIADALLPMCPFLHVDATHADVDVPSFLRARDLVLRIGRNPQVMGMPDLVLDEKGWSATVVAQGQRYSVSIPWARVHRIWIGEPFVGPLVIWPVFGDPDAETPPDGTRPGGVKLQIVH